MESTDGLAWDPQISVNEIGIANLLWRQSEGDDDPAVRILRRQLNQP